MAEVTYYVALPFVACVKSKGSWAQFLIPLGASVFRWQTSI